MESGNAEFLVGPGIDSTIGTLVYHFSRTAKVKKSENDVFNAFHEIEADTELAVAETGEEAVKIGAGAAEKAADEVTEVKDRLTPSS